jgi:hypothetical protein
MSRERWDAHAEKHDGEHQLADERWRSHTEQHETIARNLVDYKVQSNEWRGSLADLRATFAPISQLDALEAHVDARLTELRNAIATEREERRDQQSLRTGAVDTWKWIAGFLGVGGVGAIVWALLQAKP